MVLIGWKEISGPSRKAQTRVGNTHITNTMKRLFTHLLAVAIVLLALPSAFAQGQNAEAQFQSEAQPHVCGEHGNAIYDMAEQFGVLEEVVQKRNRIADRIQELAGAKNNGNCIPVVFHVIHNGEPVGVGSNIPGANIQSQIDVLNECLSATNPDIGAVRPMFQNAVGNTNIQVCLAQIDPNGNPTTGITRVQGQQGQFMIGPQNGMFMPANQWDPTQYLNIYTVTGGPGSNIGTGTPPGFPATVDGIVLDFRSVGRVPFNAGGAFFGGMFNGGRVGVHEVGHYLGLMHLDGFGNGAFNGCTGENPSTCMIVGDRCCDTPDQPQITFTCLGTEAACGSVNQIENFMQANADACKLMFTNDQANIMNATLINQRATLLNGNQCNRTFRAINITAATATLQWSGTAAAVSYNVAWNYIGMVMNAPPPPNPAGGDGAVNTGNAATQLNIAGLTANASYGWTVQAVFANGTTGPVEPMNGATFRTLPGAVAPPPPPGPGPAPVPVVCPYDPNEVAVFGPYLQPTGQQAMGIICPAADVDRYVIMDQFPERTRMYINLANVTADYDMDLVDANTGVILAQALTPGVVNENIIYDTQFPGQNYYVYIYAKPGQPITGMPFMVGMQQIPLSANPPRMSNPDLFDLNVYPNPTNGNATVSFVTEKPQYTQISVYDPSGRLVLSEATTGEGIQTQELDLSSLNAGIYRVDILNTEFRTVKPIVKQ